MEIPSTWPILGNDEVHVWCAALDFDITPAAVHAKILSEEELQRAARFVYPLDCQRFIRARVVLRSLLGYYLDVAPASIVFTRGKFGKLALCSSRIHQTLHFNLSCSHGRALFAVSRSFSVGVDIELIRPQAENLSLAERYLPPENVSRLHNLLPEERTEEFFQAWTRMEARQKVSGKGLHPEESAVNSEKATCSEENLFVRDGYAAALAVSGCGYTVRYMNWPA
jgi:4'-phosphopantetheinyl transferase